MHSLRQRINARDESGFTLIELLVVLIIIGVLLAIAVPAYLGFKDRAVKTQVQANVREAIPDAEAYFQDVGNYTNMTLTTGDPPDAARPPGHRQGSPNGLVVLGCGQPVLHVLHRLRQQLDGQGRRAWRHDFRDRGQRPCTTSAG